MNSPPDVRIAAIVLAAGRSRRMGQPKLPMAWGDTTVIGQVVRTLAFAGLDPVVVVTGGARQQVEAALKEHAVHTVYNPRYAEDQMTLSLQIGLADLPDEIDAALVALGDQPQIQLDIVQQVLQAYRESRSPLVFPSYQMRRGHPWIIARPLWDLLLKVTYSELAPSESSSQETISPRSLRETLLPYTSLIHYVDVTNDSILRDLDTPVDYDQERPVGQPAPDQEKM
jgi:molybdenum cofactor cytidylyltransferase